MMLNRRIILLLKSHTMIRLKGCNFIGSQESSDGTRTFYAKNPATGRILDNTFTEATSHEIDLAVRKAEKAFLTYRMTNPAEKAQFLKSIANELEQNQETIINCCKNETALPEARLAGELKRTTSQLHLFAQVVSEGSWVDARIDTAIPDRVPLPKPDIRQIQIPLGPVGIFGASNFPLAFSVAGGDTASALAAGCPVVVKAHPLHPGTSELVAVCILKAAQKSGMPDGVFSMVQGEYTEVGMMLVRHPGITAIGFTGSLQGGKAIFDAANRREVPIPVFAEMGSVNPVFILPGAMKERNEAIAQELTMSFTLGTGQFCTSPGLVVIPLSEDSESFMNKLKQTTLTVPPGIMLSERIRDNFNKGVGKLLENKNVSLLAQNFATANGNMVQSYAFVTDTNTFLQDKHLSEEVFGPSTIIIKASGKDDMLKIVQSLGGHLTASIHGNEKDLAEYDDLVKILERKVGRLIFNGFPTGVEVCHSMVHGGPYPATTAPQSTSVGTAAIRRFTRPFCYQNFPDTALPEALKNSNPLNIWRLINGEMTKGAIV